jgi:hypothetical protein
LAGAIRPPLGDAIVLDANNFDFDAGPGARASEGNSEDGSRVVSGEFELDDDAIALSHENRAGRATSRLARITRR